MRRQTMTVYLDAGTVGAHPEDRYGGVRVHGRLPGLTRIQFRSILAYDALRLLLELAFPLPETPALY
jgi:hypothetical protein